MRTAAPDPKDPNRIYKILQRDASTSAENEFLRFASMLLQDRPEESLVHLENILKMPKEELQCSLQKVDNQTGVQIMIQSIMFKFVQK